MDHLERAYRKEEIPLLEKDYERQKKADKVLHETARQLQLETTRTKHTSDLKIKERLTKMLSDYHSYRGEMENKRFEEFEQRRLAAQAKIEEEKEKRRQLFWEKIEEDQMKREAEEAAKLKQEEEERQLQEGTKPSLMVIVDSVDNTLCF